MTVAGLGMRILMGPPLVGGRDPLLLQPGRRRFLTRLERTRDQARSVLAGKCYCGAVHYTVADEFRYAANCHCSRCRAATGSAFKPFAGIERDKLEITRARTSSLSSARRTRTTRAAGRAARSSSRCAGRRVRSCRVWGRSSTRRRICPTEHIFVGSKAPWFEITDDLPQLTGTRSSFPPGAVAEVERVLPARPADREAPASRFRQIDDRGPGPVETMCRTGAPTGRAPSIRCARIQNGAIGLRLRPRDPENLVVPALHRRRAQRIAEDDRRDLA